MPRYVVERTLPEGMHIPTENGGVEFCCGVIERNAEAGVTWISSFVSEDKHTPFASTTRPLRRRSVRRPPAMICRSTGSPRCAYSTPTSTKGRGRDAQMRNLRAGSRRRTSAP